MKILIFAHDSSLYGASKSLLSLLEYWQKNGLAELLVILPYAGKLEENLQLSDITYLIHPFPRCDYKYDNQTFIQRMRLKLAYLSKKKTNLVNLQKIINDFQPQLIYTNTSVVSIGFDIARKNKIPHVWHIREFGWEDYGFKFLPSGKVHKEKIQDSNTIFVSKALQGHWLDNKPMRPTAVIYNGLVGNINTSVMALEQKSNILSMLGAITRGKGQKTAIEAVHILHKRGMDVCLEIYGTPFDKVYYEELVQWVGGDEVLKHRVRFCGFTDDIDQVYSRTFVMLNCSDNEGFGRTIVEAMQRGVPVVANNSGGVPEIISHMQNGMLYNQTAGNLADAIERLLTETVLYNKIREQAYKTAIEKYSIKNYSNFVLQFLKETISNND